MGSCKLIYNFVWLENNVEIIALYYISQYIVSSLHWCVPSVYGNANGLFVMFLLFVCTFSWTCMF